MRKEKKIRDPNETHLGYIQSIISRMAQNSFQTKTWCISVVAALLSFYLSKDSCDLRDYVIWISCVTVILFYFVDSYYLYLERGYRYLYNVVSGIAISKISIKEYDLSIPQEYRCWNSIKLAIISWSTGGFYSIVIISLIILKISL